MYVCLLWIKVVSVPVAGDPDEVPLVVGGVAVAEGGDEAELLRQPLVEDPPATIQCWVPPIIRVTL